MKGAARPAPRRGLPRRRPAGRLLPRDRLARARPGAPRRRPRLPRRARPRHRGRLLPARLAVGRPPRPARRACATPTSSPRPASASRPGCSCPGRARSLRPWLISRRHPIPTSAGFATIILERLVDLITVLVLFALYLFVLPGPGRADRGARLDWSLLQARGRGRRRGACPRRCLGVLLAPCTRTRIGSWPRGRAAARARPALAGGAARADPARVLGRPRRAARPRPAPPRRSRPVARHLAARSRSASTSTTCAFGIHLPFQATFLLIAFLPWASPSRPRGWWAASTPST